MERAATLGKRYACRMLGKWLQDGLKAAGVSQAELARQLTQALGRSIDRAAVNKMVTGDRSIKADEMLEITRILQSAPPGQTRGVRSVRVAAYVQAGYWAETWEWADDEQYDVAVPDEPQLAGFKLYAAETRGPSMNRRWPERTVVVFTDVDETHESPTPGKRYVVQRLRPDGQREHTVKLLHRDEAGKLWLIPESSDPLFQAPISLEDGTGGEDIVAIIGRVHFAVTRE